MPVIAEGGRGLGVEAFSTNFPFVAPSDDIRYLFADFYLTHENRTAVLPFRIDWVYGLCRAQGTCASEAASESSGVPEPEHEADLRVVDADGTVIFDSTAADGFSAVDWGGRFRIYEWRTDTEVCRAVIHSGTNDAEDVRQYEIEFSPESAVLDERTHAVVPSRIKTIEVNGEIFTDAVDFVLGYNFAMEAGEDSNSVRDPTRLILTAEPGQGLGRYPSCEEPELLIRRINGVAGDENGNFILSAAGCYWFEVPTTAQGATATIVPHTLWLNNNCGPCCECADYEKTYNGIRRLYDAYKAIGRGSEDVRNLFRENKARWLAERDCRKANPTRAVMILHDKYVEMAASYCNMTSECQYDVEMKLEFDSPVDGSPVPCLTFVTGPNGGQIQAALTGAWPEFSYFWPSMDASTSVSIRARFHLPDLSESDEITLTVSPFLSGIAQPTKSTTKSIAGCEG